MHLIGRLGWTERAGNFLCRSVYCGRREQSSECWLSCCTADMPAKHRTNIDHLAAQERCAPPGHLWAASLVIPLATARRHPPVMIDGGDCLILFKISVTKTDHLACCPAQKTSPPKANLASAISLLRRRPRKSSQSAVPENSRLR